MAKLQDLPNELVSRISHELDGGTSPNSLHSLVLTCKTFYRAALPRLYEHITIRSRTQLEALVDKQSGAWRLPPYINIKHIYFHVASLDLLEVFMKPLAKITIHPAIQRLAQVVASGAEDYLETISVAIGHLDDILSPDVDYESWTFCPAFLTIPAKTVECTHVDALLGTVRHSFDVTVSCRTIATLLDGNLHIERLQLPFLDLCLSSHVFVHALRRAPRKITHLRLDCPIGLHNDILESLLLGLGDTLEEKGLVIALLPSHDSQPASASFLEYLEGLDHFRLYNEGLDPAKVEANLTSEGAAVEALMRKLDGESNLSRRRSESDTCEISPVLFCSHRKRTGIARESAYPLRESLEHYLS